MLEQETVENGNLAHSTVRNNGLSSMTGSQIVLHDDELVRQCNQIQILVGNIMGLPLSVQCSFLELITTKPNMCLLLEGNRNLQHEACELLEPEDGHSIPTVRRKFSLLVEQMHDCLFREADSNEGIVDRGVSLWPWFDDSDSDDSQEAEETEETLGNSSCATKIAQSKKKQSKIKKNTKRKFEESNERRTNHRFGKVFRHQCSEEDTENLTADDSNSAAILQAVGQKK